MPDPTNPTSSSTSDAKSSHLTQKWHDFVRAEKKWWHHFFSRDNLLDWFKTVAWVAPLTILIWVYAEREQLAVESGVAFPIDVRSTDPTRVASLIKPSEKIIMAELTGPRAKLDQVRELLNGGLSPHGIQIDIESNQPAGTQQIATREAIQNNSIFRENGITVTNCQPPRLEIEVDQFFERDVDVQLPPGVTNLIGSPVFEPRKVKIRGPQSLLDGAALQGQLTAYVDIANQDALKMPGHHDLPAVSVLASIRNEHVTVTPSTIHVALDVKQTNVEYKIPSMPIFIVSPPGLLDKYKVVVNNNNPILTNVTVFGPQEKIELLQKDTYVPKPRAALEVTRDDLPAGEPHQRRPRFELPEGVTVSNEDAKREVEFKLVDRSAPEP